MTDLSKLLARLAENEVAFIVIGGMAAISHGGSRLTQDLDIVYQRQAENLKRLVQALSDESPYLRGAPPGLPFRWSTDTLRLGLNFTLETKLGPIDLFGEVTGGGGYEALFDSSFEVEIFGMKCRVLDLPSLIRVKRAAGRPKDIEAIAELEAIWQERQEK